MDFRKVLDQTVREIKREVNLKVLKVPEIEQKVLDATSDEPWGPHGSDLADIARATKSYGECEMIMNVLWQRLGNTGANWRHVYKALAVIEYLLANGTERAVDDIVDNSSQIAKLTRFEYLESNGKDVGLNVRKKAEAVLAILDDREKLQEVREKAAATRDKYFGLSSTGITYKSSAASFGSGNYSSGSHYGSTGGSRELGSFKHSSTGIEWRKNNNGTASNYSSNRGGSKEIANSATSYESRKSEGHGRRNQDFSTSHSKLSANLSTTSGSPISKKGENEDEDGDFNPRGSSTSATARSNHLDLFGPSLMDDPVDSAASTSTATPNVSSASVPEVDLFADATFQSANFPLEAATVSHTQDNIDLFAGRLSSADSLTSDTEFSVRGSPNKSSEQKKSSIAHPSTSTFDPFQQSFATSFPSDTEFSVRDPMSKSFQGKSHTPQHSSTAAFDPFAAIPLKSFGGSESFGTFSSNTGSNVTELPRDSSGGLKSSDHGPLEDLNFGAFTSHSESATTNATLSMNKPNKKLGQDSLSASKSAMKKETFQVKSGIWADSLSRGLINLNITSPKKVNLSDVGVVRQLSDESEEKGPGAPWYMGATMGTAPGLVRSSFPSSTETASGSGHFQHQQFGRFK